jgi:hypothetical protein
MGRFTATGKECLSRYGIERLYGRSNQDVAGQDERLPAATVPEAGPHDRMLFRRPMMLTSTPSQE